LLTCIQPDLGESVGSSSKSVRPGAQAQGQQCHMHGLQVCSSHPPSCGCCSSRCSRPLLLLGSCIQGHVAVGARGAGGSRSNCGPTEEYSEHSDQGRTEGVWCVQPCMTGCTPVHSGGREGYRTANGSSATNTGASDLQRAGLFGPPAAGLVFNWSYERLL
jgi:hypothetical protein